MGEFVTITFPGYSHRMFPRLDSISLSTMSCYNIVVGKLLMWFMHWLVCDEITFKFAMTNHLESKHFSTQFQRSMDSRVIHIFDTIWNTSCPQQFTDRGDIINTLRSSFLACSTAPQLARRTCPIEGDLDPLQDCQEMQRICLYKFKWIVGLLFDIYPNNSGIWHCFMDTKCGTSSTTEEINEYILVTRLLHNIHPLRRFHKEEHQLDIQYHDLECILSDIRIPDEYCKDG